MPVKYYSGFQYFSLFFFGGGGNKIFLKDQRVVCVCPSLKFGNNSLTRDEICSRGMPLDVSPVSHVTNNNMADELANYDMEASTALLGLGPVQLSMERGLRKIWNAC
jgi:hypothetical protein